MRKTWEPWEIAILSDIYPISTNEQLRKAFPYRDLYSVYKKAYKMGFRKSPEIVYKNRSNAKRGPNASNWSGGVKMTKKGYRMVHLPDHHRADKNGYVMEHIVVFERETGIAIPDNCCIHHLNGDKSDNRIENLCLMEHGAHTTYHHTGTHLSDESKQKIRDVAKDRLSDKRRHPSYKAIDVSEMAEMRKSGAKVIDICAKYGISRNTFYNKMEEYHAQSNSFAR